MTLPTEAHRVRWDNVREVGDGTTVTRYLRCATSKCRPGIAERFRPEFFQLLWSFRRGVEGVLTWKGIANIETEIRETHLPLLRYNLERVPAANRPHPVEDHWKIRIATLEAFLELITTTRGKTKPATAVSLYERSTLVNFFEQDFDL
jgi:hypothetical protein